jgi:hypothetical protein
MNSEVVFKSSPLKSVFLIFSGALFGILGLISTIWLAAIAGGIAILAGFFLMSEKFYLKVNVKGIEVHSPFARAFIQWGDISYLDIVSIHGRDSVFIKYASHYKPQTLLQSVDPTAFIPNIFDVEPQELLNILNEWHARYGKQLPNIDRTPISPG